jgi:hypothetical protein
MAEREDRDPDAERSARTQSRRRTGAGNDERAAGQGPHEPRTKIPESPPYQVGEKTERQLQHEPGEEGGLVGGVEWDGLGVEESLRHLLRRVSERRKSEEPQCRHAPRSPSEAAEEPDRHPHQQERDADARDQWEDGEGAVIDAAGELDSTVRVTCRDRVGGDSHDP